MKAIIEVGENKPKTENLDKTPNDVESAIWAAKLACSKGISEIEIGKDVFEKLAGKEATENYIMIAGVAAYKKGCLPE